MLKCKPPQVGKNYPPGYTIIIVDSLSNVNSSEAFFRRRTQSVQWNSIAEPLPYAFFRRLQSLFVSVPGRPYVYKNAQPNYLPAPRPVKNDTLSFAETPSASQTAPVPSPSLNLFQEIDRVEFSLVRNLLLSLRAVRHEPVYLSILIGNDQKLFVLRHIGKLTAPAFYPIRSRQIF